MLLDQRRREDEGHGQRGQRAHGVRARRGGTHAALAGGDLSVSARKGMNDRARSTRVRAGPKKEAEREVGIRLAWKVLVVSCSSNWTFIALENGFRNVI